MTQPMPWGIGTSDYGVCPERRVESVAWAVVAEAVRDADITRGDMRGARPAAG